MTWELRWHPFRGEWVLFTSHRDARPWIGERAAPEEPPYEPALAPGGTRLHGTNPDYRGVYVFNDLPVSRRTLLSLPDTDSEAEAPDDLYRTRRALGSAEVVCYHHDPTRSMADLTDDEMSAIVATWRERTAALQGQEGVAPSSSSRTGAPWSAPPIPIRTVRSTPARWCTPPWPARLKWRASITDGLAARCWPR